MARSDAVTWEVLSAPAGLGWIAFAASELDARILVPPRLPFPGADHGVDGWRLVTYRHEAEPPELDLDLELAARAAAATELSSAEVLKLVGDELRDWVRAIMRGQCDDALAFASVARGDFPDEERARASATRLLALHRDLSEAFPLERWYVVPVPDGETVDALISQRPTLAAQKVTALAARVRWLDVVTTMLDRAARRPRSRRLLETRLGSRILRLSRASAVRADAAEQPTGDMLAISS